PDKGRMELMGHKTAEMTARYTHLSVEYKRQAVAGLPQFGMVLESESQQISQQANSENVVAFARSLIGFSFGASSNGRTADSGSAYRGSNPCVPVPSQIKT